IFEEGPEQGDQLFTRREIFFQAHPGTRPAVQIPAIVFQVITWRSGGAVYFGSSRFYQLPLHAATHHDSKSLPPVSGIRLSAGPFQFRSQEHWERGASPQALKSPVFALPPTGSRIRPTARANF